MQAGREAVPRGVAWVLRRHPTPTTAPTSERGTAAPIHGASPPTGSSLGGRRAFSRQYRHPRSSTRNQNRLSCLSLTEKSVKPFRSSRQPTSSGPPGEVCVALRGAAK